MGILDILGSASSGMAQGMQDAQQMQAQKLQYDLDKAKRDADTRANAALAALLHSRSSASPVSEVGYPSVPSSPPGNPSPSLQLIGSGNSTAARTALYNCGMPTKSANHVYALWQEYPTASAQRKAEIDHALNTYSVGPFTFDGKGMYRRRPSSEKLPSSPTGSAPSLVDTIMAQRQNALRQIVSLTGRITPEEVTTINAMYPFPIPVQQVPGDE